MHKNLDTLTDEVFNYLNKKLKEEPMVNGIYKLRETDMTDLYFFNWILNTGEFENIDPDKLDFTGLAYDESTCNYSYGYFYNGKLEGTIRATYTEGDNFYGISFLYVNPDKWNEGIGQKLLRFILDKYGDHDLLLNVIEGNDKAIYIYEKYGFHKIRFIECEENFFVMEKKRK